MERLQPELWPEDTGYREVEREGKRYLQLKENGDCVYLSETGCSIHETRPQACRPFDCLELLEVVNKLPQAYSVIPDRVIQAAIERQERNCSIQEG